VELRQLRYFLAVLEEGNLSRAAKKLNMSQPPLSTQMKLLEGELGCELFLRGARRVTPTGAGRLLYERAKAITALCDETEQAVREYGEGIAGALRLGVVSSVSARVAQEWAPAFQREYPGIRFDLFEANSYQLLDQVRSGSVELAVVRTPFPEEGVTVTPLERERMLAVGRAEFFEGLASPLRLAALGDRPLILYRRWERILLEELERAGVRPQIVCRNDDARTTVLWADAGLGIGIVPASAAALLRGEGTLSLPLADGETSSQIALVSGRAAPLSGVGRAFLEFIREHFLEGRDDEHAV
jgi:LysR family transcriptional regulator, salicylic acid-responsive activator of bsdBCD